MAFTRVRSSMAPFIVVPMFAMTMTGVSRWMRTVS